MKRSMQSIFVIILLLLINGCSAAPASNATSAQQPVTIRIGYQTGWAPNANIGVALERTNILDKHNLKGELIRFQAGPQLSEAILGGKVDIGFQGDGPTMALLARQTPVKILAKLVDYKGELLVQTNSKVQTVADLRGSKIGVMFGSGAYRQLLDWLAAANLDATSEVDLINLAPNEWLPALYSGQVEAIAGWAPGTVQPVLEKRARSIQSGWSRGVLLVTEKFLKAHPDAVTEFLKAYREAIWTMTNDKTQVNQWVAELTGWVPAVVAASAQEDRNYREAKSLEDVIVRLSDQELNDLQALGDFLVAQKRLDRRPDVRGALHLGPIDQVEPAKK
jgi:sulfonate transport system substrate-binding protein